MYWILFNWRRSGKACFGVSMWHRDRGENGTFCIKDSQSNWTEQMLQIWGDITCRRRQQRRWQEQGRRWANWQEQATIWRQAPRFSEKWSSLLMMSLMKPLSLRRSEGETCNQHNLQLEPDQVLPYWSDQWSSVSNRDINGLFQVGRVELDRSNLNNVWRAMNDEALRGIKWKEDFETYFLASDVTFLAWIFKEKVKTSRFFGYEIRLQFVNNIIWCSSNGDTRYYHPCRPRSGSGKQVWEGNGCWWGSRRGPWPGCGHLGHLTLIAFNSKFLHKIEFDKLGSSLEPSAHRAQIRSGPLARHKVLLTPPMTGNMRHCTILTQ